MSSISRRRVTIFFMLVEVVRVLHNVAEILSDFTSIEQRIVFSIVIQIDLDHACYIFDVLGTVIKRRDRRRPRTH